MSEVRVRFAPSPTGFLHVGGARTAIFNWLFARNQGGKFLLRIEDTDKERSRSELSGQIIRSMNWLGMISDEPIVYQSDRTERFREICFELVKNGKAYYAFETADELDAKRKEASAKKIPFKYDRASLKYGKATVEKFLAEGKEHTIRFLVPEGETVFDDMVHGKTSFSNSELDDFVILRSDGSPVYQVAVVVDDHDMNITHVIRGDDHLSNTPKQILLYNALGWDVPKFAHLPMILDEEKKKLSKRRNPVACEEYKDKGFLPEAMFNFLTLLGFAPADNKEVLSREDLIKEFTFERVNKSSAVFDMKKLNWLNSEYIKSTDDNLLAEMIRERLTSPNPLLRKEGTINESLPLKKGEMSEGQRGSDYILKVVHLMKERVSTINDFIEFGKYFFAEPENYDEKGLAKYWNDETKELMKEYLEGLTTPPLRSSPPFKEGELKGWSQESLPLTKGEKSEGQRGFEWSSWKLERSLRDFCDSKNIKAANLIHPLRLALTGITISPGIFEMMEVLGKEACVRRIEKLINH